MAEELSQSIQGPSSTHLGTTYPVRVIPQSDEDTNTMGSCGCGSCGGGPRLPGDLFAMAVAVAPVAVAVAPVAVAPVAVAPDYRGI